MYIPKMITLKMNKTGRVGPGMIKGMLLTLIFLVILLKMLPNLMHTSQESVSELSTEYQNSTLYGEGAAAIGADVPTYTGYFWVAGPIILLLTVIFGIFMSRRR